jgi:anti-sigma factor ChrR (cupin superfamily)
MEGGVDGVVIVDQGVCKCCWCYPAHRHAGTEELHLLHGILKVDDRTLYPGDFIHSEAGSVDHRVWSETGYTCFLMTSTEDALF